MPRISIHNVGTGGIIRDIPPHLLPPEVWSDGQNVRFQDDKVLKFDGHSAVFDPPSVAPYWALGVPTAIDHFVLYAGLAKVFTANGGDHFDITRAVGGDYTGAAANDWNGGLLGSIPVITNGTDVPQVWSPIATTQRLVDLVNWPATDRAKVIKPFKNFLVALNLTISGTTFLHRVKTSQPADPGSLPDSWDETDPTKDVVVKELDDTQAGIIQDGEELRDIFVIYKDASTWGMQFTGGRFIFRFFKIFNSTGILTQRCVVPIVNGSFHFVATGDDLILHDGQNAQSLIDKGWKRFLASTIDSDNIDRSFCVSNPRKDEAWFCFPKSGSTLPDLALVWNRRDGIMGVRDLQEAAFIASTVVNDIATSQAWDDDAGSWEGDTTTWDERLFNPQALDLLQCDPTNTKLFHMDRTSQFNNVNMTSFVQRDGLAIVGVDRQGHPKADIGVHKLLKRVWPKAEGGPFEVRVGSQQSLGGPITFQSPQTFTPGTDDFVDVCVEGRLLTIRFQSTADVAWKLHGYDVEIEVLGGL